MKKKIAVLMAMVLIMSVLFTGCREASKVSYNMSKDADYFETERRITVYNAISNKILLEIEGYMSISNTEGEDELVVICKTGPKEYKRNLVYLGKATLYIVEDISGTHSDPYHYEIDVHLLPQFDFDLKR